MIGRIDYLHLPEGASPQLQNELRKMVDQFNAILAEIEHRMEKMKEGS